MLNTQYNRKIFKVLELQSYRESFLSFNLLMESWPCIFFTQNYYDASSSRIHYVVMNLMMDCSRFLTKFQFWYVFQECPFVYFFPSLNSAHSVLQGILMHYYCRMLQSHLGFLCNFLCLINILVYLFYSSIPSFCLLSVSFVHLLDPLGQQGASIRVVFLWFRRTLMFNEHLILIIL